MLFENHVSWQFPTTKLTPQAMFGAKRKYDIHTGIDIYVPFGTKIFPIEEGKVINVEWFTGEHSMPPTPWWNNTQAVWVQSKSGLVFVYGELQSNVAINDLVTPNICIGTILQVLKQDKGKNPPTMLHLELYDSTPNETVVWRLNESKPPKLLNPLDYFSKRNKNV